MLPKQSEMDGIVKQIFGAIEMEPHFRSTLLVLCGDHGMNDAGNHGGSAESETSPALVFLSPKFQTISNGSECPIARPEGIFHYYNKVDQSDIAPTLAGLLGFPVPLNNLGVFIPDFLPLWSEGMGLLRKDWQSLLTCLKTVRFTSCFRMPDKFLIPSREARSISFQAPKNILNVRGQSQKKRC